MKISKEKREKIIEQILAFLYNENPKSVFTAHIARELARDEEFIKKILFELKIRKLVIEVKKNPLGMEYKKRSRWRLADITYRAYKEHQNKY